MKVNSDAQVANLDSDKLDGKSATEIGVNDRLIVSNSSLSSSNSPKGVGVACPPGKVLVGTGYDINGGSSGAPGNEVTDVVLNSIFPTSSSQVFVDAYEEGPTSSSWQVVAYAICATAP
jgi:hypothetical protein